MSEVQFDEVFQKLEKVIKEIITKREYESITGQKFYDKFKVEFGILSSPAMSSIEKVLSLLLSLLVHLNYSFS